MKQVTVVSLGGSIAPDKVDHQLIADFGRLSWVHTKADSRRKLVIVTGGRSSARIYQEAYRAIVENADSDQLDWIGVAATHLNGQLVEPSSPGVCPDPLVIDPTAEIEFSDRYWQPPAGNRDSHHSTTLVVLAERLDRRMVIYQT